MPRPKKNEEGTNITVRLSKEEYDFLVSKTKTKYGDLSFTEVIRAIIRIVMNNNEQQPES